MGWSTQQLAELAGTTLRTVRHYHEVGLLEDPPRRANGYKEYQVRHLVRLLQIRRLAGLGMSLEQIATLPVAGSDPFAELEAIHDDLAQTIQKLEEARADIAAVLEHGEGATLPAGFSAVAGGLTDADRSLVTVYSSVFTDDAMRGFREILPRELTDVDRQFSELTEDADVETRIRLAERMAPGLRALYAQHPWLTDPAPSPAVGSHETLRSTVDQAMTELYNLAQIEVVYRTHLLATDQRDDRLQQPESRG